MISSTINPKKRRWIRKRQNSTTAGTFWSSLHHRKKKLFLPEKISNFVEKNAPKSLKKRSKIISTEVGIVLFVSSFFNAFMKQ